MEVRLALRFDSGSKAKPVIVRMAACPRIGELVTYASSFWRVQEVQHDAIPLEDELQAGVTVHLEWVGPIS